MSKRRLISAAKDLAAWVLCVSGVAAFSRWRNRKRLAILMFHGIEQQPLSPACWHVLDVDTFRRELDYVRRHFRVLPLEEALQRLEAGTLPNRAATLTFDDGTRNLATNAAPALHDFGLPAAVFLATGPMGTDWALWPDRLWLAFARTAAADADLTAVGLGNRSLRSIAERGDAYAAAVQRFKSLPDGERITRLDSLVATLAPGADEDPGPFRMLSWDQARAMAKDGRVTFHPHSVTHPILARCPDEKVEHEVSESCATIERETGGAPTVFAYPNGRAEDFDDRAKSALRRRGVRWALATRTGFADAASDPLALPRLPVGSDMSFARFRLLVSGAVERHPPSPHRHHRRNHEPGQ